MKTTIKELALPASIIISAVILATAIQPIADQSRLLNYCSEEWEIELIKREKYWDSPEMAKANAARICNGGEAF